MVGTGEAFAEVRPVDRKKLQQLVTKGRAQYIVGALDGAGETFLKVRELSPSNPDPAATYFLRRIEQDREDIENEKGRERKTTVFATPQRLDGWVCRLGIRRTVSTDAPSWNPLQEKIGKLLVPGCDLLNMSLGQAISRLAALAEEAEKAQAGDFPADSPHVNMVLFGGEADEMATTRVNLRLQPMSFRRVLDILTESVGYRYAVTDIITIRPAKEAGNSLEMEKFPVSRSAGR